MTIPKEGGHLTRVRGELERRFRWSRLRFELGHYDYYTIPEIGLGTKIWNWENISSK